jgi:acetoin utilization deacetylase AcuC-like enzyme
VQSRDPRRSTAGRNRRLHSWLTQQIVALADRHGEGRIVSTLEGGYSHTALAEAGAAHVRALFGLAD